MNRLAASVIAVLSMVAMPAWADELLFRDEQYLFRFLYPDSWAQVQARGENVRASVSNDGGRGLANCNVVVRRVPEVELLTRAEIEAQTVGMFTREFMEEIVQSTFEAEVIQTSEDKLDNRPAGFALVNLTYQTAGIRIDATNIVAVTITRLGIFIITCGAVRDQFERVRPELMKIITSFVFEDSGQTAARQYRQYTDPGNGFSIEYPDNWEVIPGREPVTKLKVAGPLGQTCSAIVVDASWVKKFSAKEIIVEIMQKNFFENSILENFEGATLKDKDSVYLGNQEAVLLVFSYLYKALGINVEMTVMDITTWKYGKIFRILCVTDTSTFAQSSETFRGIIRSFVILIR